MRNLKSIIGLVLLVWSFESLALSDYPIKCDIYDAVGKVVKSVDGTIEIGSQTVVLEADRVYFSMPLRFSQKDTQLYTNGKSTTLVTVETNRIGKITSSGDIDNNHSYECSAMVRKS